MNTTIAQERQVLFLKCIEYISLYLDLDKNLIMKSKETDYVIARYILVRVMCNYYSDGEVAKITGLTRPGVNKIKNSFSSRFNSARLCNLYNRIYNVIKENFLV